MFKFRLDADDSFLILAPRWSDFGTVWQYTLLALLLAVPLLLILCLYRYELRLVSRLAACGTLCLRLLILLVIWIAIGVQPHIAEERVEESPGRVRVAIDLSTSMDVVDHQYTPKERASLARSLGRADVDELTRKQIVARILGPDGLALLDRLAARHQIEIVGFHQEQVDLQPEQLLTALTDSKAVSVVLGTDLHMALVEKSSKDKHPLRGIILFSDGQHNAEPPRDKLGVPTAPIFPVVIGSREPPSDLMIVRLVVKDQYFKGKTDTVEIHCRVTNMPVQEMTVEMQLGDKKVLPEHRRVIAHDGQREHIVTFNAKMDEVGTHEVKVTATSKAGKEITLANNVARRFIRVIDDKIKVLLVDGEARWEHQYLANALRRDPKIALERVVFSQLRIGAIKDADLDKAGLPKSKLPEWKADSKEMDPLLDYPFIILGDVSPDDLPSADRQRLLKYVGERGGTLMLVAGKRYLPLAYTRGPKADDDPLVKMLPITAATELRPEAGFLLRPTSEGKMAPFLSLGDTPEADVWPELPRHYWGIVGKRKPAASVLLAPFSGVEPPVAGKESDTGILVQQDYGFGRVVFLGLESTWRWRFRIGDKFHHRFWGQLAHLAAAEELLPAGNRWIRYGSRKAMYVEGQEAELAVRLNAALPPLKDSSAVRMKLFRKNTDGTEKLIDTLGLTKQPRQPNLYEVKAPKLPPGEYRVEPDIPPYREQLAEPSDEKDAASKGGDLFRIMPREQRELLDLSTDWSKMESLANGSGGKLLTPENVEEVLDRLERRIERKELRTENKPWQHPPMVWWMLGLLLGLLTLEWGWRKWLDLP